ncbi:MAG: hypothetical protein ACI9W5_000479, partial [Ulvibacter sp.]
MSLLKKLLLVSILLFSYLTLAGDCFKFTNAYEISFSGNGNNNCTSNEGLSVYSHKRINQSKFLEPNGKGYTISLTFDRDNYTISGGNEIILFGVYSDIAALNTSLELGIDSGNNLFVNVPDEKINVAIFGDDDATKPHILILSYNSQKKQISLTIDGVEVMEGGIEPISDPIKRIIIGRNFQGSIGPILGFSNKLDQIERFYESDRLGIVYKVPVSPLRQVAGIKMLKRLCTSSQLRSDKGINECVSSDQAFSTIPLDEGVNIPAGSSVATAGTFNLECDAGYISSLDPNPPTYTVDADEIVTATTGTCIITQCSVSNIPDGLLVNITSTIDYGNNQSFTCDADYIGSTILNCTGDQIDMSGNTDCSDVSTTAAIEDYINTLIAASTPIDNPVRQAV